jgi:hypothetical protein
VLARLFIIDHSLKSPGGHHLDYTLQLAIAAQSQSIETVVATHQRFRSKELFPSGVEVRNCFRESTYSRFSDFFGVASICDQGGVGKQDASPNHASIPSNSNSDPHGNNSNSEPIHRWNSLISKWVAPVKRWYREQSRNLIANRIAQDLQTCLAKEKWRESDHVMFTTLSDIDLLGLKQFLLSNPAASLAQFHLQFHFPIFDGRPAEYGQQNDRFNLARLHCSEFVKSLEKFQLKFYCTSDLLADQYNLLGVFNFRALPYPINPQFFSPHDKRKQSDSRLRLTCAGGIRQEKGYQQLEAIAHELWPTHVKNHKLQLVVQRKEPTGLKWLRTVSITSLIRCRLTTMSRSSSEPILDY